MTDFWMELAEVGRTGDLPPPTELEFNLGSADAYEKLTPPLCSRHPDTVLQRLRDVGLLAKLLPELDATFAFSQEGGRRHKDVWEHTKAVVRQAVPRPVIRWAAALHDIGKVTTRRFLNGGGVTFHGHAEEGVRMFRRGPSRRILFPLEIRDRVELLILHHLRPGAYEPSWTDSAVRRFYREMAPFFGDLMDLSRADITSKRPGQRARRLEVLKALETRVEALAAQDAHVPPLPAGLGNLLMRELGLPPGKHIGVLRAQLEALCEAGELEPGQEAAYYVTAARALAPIKPG
jgi:poly(A) polymerase